MSLCPRFAVADTVYRALRTERRDQAVMISGESGAGKTEATKRLLQFYAETCPAPERGGAVRDRLLQSNPVLEVRGHQHLRRGREAERRPAILILHPLLGLWKCQDPPE